MVEQILCGSLDMVVVYFSTQDPLRNLEVYNLKSSKESLPKTQPCYRHTRVTISNSSLSPCKKNLLEQQANGDFTVVDLFLGKTIAEISSSFTRRILCRQLQFGFLRRGQLFTVWRDLRSRGHGVDFFSIYDSSLLRTVDLDLYSSESLVSCISTWSGLILNTFSDLTFRKFRILSVSLEGTLTVQQAEVSDCCGLYGDCSTLVHCHQVNMAGCHILVIQDFL